MSESDEYIMDELLRITGMIEDIHRKFEEYHDKFKEIDRQLFSLTPPKKWKIKERMTK